jgi:hypothetical protein
VEREMRNKVLLSVVLLLFSGAAAFAAFAPVGDPIEGGSWGQRFQKSGGDFDLVAVRIVDGRHFESTTHRNFSEGGWQTTYEIEGPQWPQVSQATAQGPFKHDLEWEIWFESDKSEPLEFDFVAFNGDTCRESAHANWDGNHWAIDGDGCDWHPDRDTLLIPAPGAALLGAVGLGTVGLGIFVWFRRQPP